MNETKDPNQGHSAGEQSTVAPAKRSRGGAKAKPSSPQKKAASPRQASRKTATAKAPTSTDQTSPEQISSDQTPPDKDSKAAVPSSSSADSRPARAKSSAKDTGKSVDGKPASRSSRGGKTAQSRNPEASLARPATEAAPPRAIEGSKAKALEGNSQQQLTGSNNKALPASSSPALEPSHRGVLETVEREALEGRRQKAITQGAEATKQPGAALGGSSRKGVASKKGAPSANDKAEGSGETPETKKTGPKPASGSRRGRSSAAKTSRVKTASAEAPGAVQAETTPADALQAVPLQAQTLDPVVGGESGGTEPAVAASSPVVPEKSPEKTAGQKSSRGRGRRGGAGKKNQPAAPVAPETSAEAANTAEALSDMPTGADAPGAANAQEPQAKENAGHKKNSAGKRRGGRKPRAEATPEEADLAFERDTDFDLDDPLDAPSLATDAVSDLDDDPDDVPAVDAGQGGRGKKGQPQAVKQVRRKMFVCVHPEEQVEVVLTEEGQVQEYFVEMLQQAKTKGNIYKATINNLDANLQAAFVSYGANKNGFLQIDEVHPEYFNTPHDTSKNRRYPPIQKALKQGQELLVQVVKEPSGTKGAFLTTYLSLPGRFLVLTPGREQIGVSRKVDNEEERSRLREMLTGLKPGPGLGVIVRTVSVGTSKSTLQKDLQNLKRTWKEIRKRGTEEPAPTLIYQEMSLTTRAVRDYLTDQVVEVWLDDEETARSVEEMAKIHFPQKNKLVNLHKVADTTLFERFNLQRQLDQIHSREVTLPSGGRLVIDPTEALTAIDINSGRSGGKNNFEDMAYRTNIEAAKMIPLQLRLRDIGGQVVIDFIEMRDKSHWREVEKTIRAGMKNDRARHDIGRVSPFGLMELVRQRLGSSAISVSTEVCPHCKGTGVRRNMEWQTQTALRDIDRKLQVAKDQGQVMLLFEVEAGVAMHLLNTKRQRLVEMEQQYGVHLEITPIH